MADNFFNINPITSTKSDDPLKHRLNGYDNAILNEIEGLEYNISEKEKELIDINGKIKNAEIYGTESEVLSLKVRKQRLERELYDLRKQQSANSKTAKTLTGEVIEIPWIRKAQRFLSKKVLAGVSKRFQAIAFLGESMEKLSEINKNVNELVEMKVPYGEKNDNYEKLTQYLYKAGKIHSQISKTMAKVNR